MEYGAALNEGRALFASDEQFGQWLVTAKLSAKNDQERAGAREGLADMSLFSACPIICYASVFSLGPRCCPVVFNGRPRLFAPVFRRGGSEILAYRFPNAKGREIGPLDSLCVIWPPLPRKPPRRDTGPFLSGFLAYRRAIFPSDELFGQWLVSANLAGTLDHERAAAMWAAANPDQFAAALN